MADKAGAGGLEGALCGAGGEGPEGPTRLPSACSFIKGADA